MRPLILASLGLCLALVANAEAPIGWEDLVDPASQTFDDPFQDLSYDQLMAASTIAMLRTQLEGKTATEEVQAQLDEANAVLAASGIDADWLIDQRWVVAERRELAASIGNPAYDGVEVSLGGFAIPAPPDEDGTPTAYLVPERGMCAHIPPPNPNQMIRLRLMSGETPQSLHEAVQVMGRLEIAPTAHQIVVVDGFVQMRATFAMEVQKLDTYGGATVENMPPAAATNEWAERIAERMRATRGGGTDGN